MAINFNLKGLLQDEEFLLGAGLLSAGSQGQNIGKAAFPALIQAGKTANFFENAQFKTDKAKALQDLLQSDQIDPTDKLYIAAGLTPPKKQKPKKLTTADLAIGVYSKLQGLRGDEFTNAFNELPQTEQDVYTKVIKGNEDIFNKLLSDAMKGNSLNKNASNPESDKIITEEMITKTMAANKDATREEVIKALEDAGYSLK